MLSVKTTAHGASMGKIINGGAQEDIMHQYLVDMSSSFASVFFVKILAVSSDANLQLGSCGSACRPHMCSGD